MRRPVKPATRLLRVGEVAARVGYAPKSLWNQRAEGREPGCLGVRVSGRAVRWFEDDIEDWLERQRRGEPLETK